MTERTERSNGRGDERRATSVRAKSDARAAANKQARKTALLVGSVLLAIAAWNYHRGRTTVVEVFGVVGALLVLVGLLVPPAARAFHAGWMKLAHALGWVNSRVLLTALFYGVFAPYGFLSRLAGRDPLRRRQRGGETYWTTRTRTRQTREQFERLF
ncbi:MAG: SxtJ family membrane protein [Acidobacteria bacterium]|nr:SxtJ family membrane protein [Acidobacteriota bacterium]